MTTSFDLAPALGPYLDPLALSIVGGGTLLATILRTPARDLGRAVRALATLGRRRFSAAALVAQVGALGRIARRHGVIALDRSVIHDADVAGAIADIVDGLPPHEVARRLAEAQAARVDRHAAAADVWSAVAEIAPAMGMIGTLIGLVRMFTTMDDPTAIGGAMAVALLTTLYGAAIATLIAMPIAARLRRMAEEEAQERDRLVAPLTALAERERPGPRIALAETAAA